LLVALACLALPAAARAGAKESKERAAKTACLTGDYAKGVALLADLYISTGNIIFLFNLGRCFEQNGKYEEAIVRFREYQQKNADKGNAPDDEAEKHIAKCQVLLDKQKPALAAAAAVVEASAERSPAIEPATPKPAVETKPTVALEPRVEIAKAASPAAQGRGLRVGGIAAAAVGVGGIATGLILNLKANSLAKDLEAANGSSTTLYSQSKESSRSTYQTWAWVAYGAGAACMAGGALLLYLGYSRGQDAQVAFVPTVGGGNFGAALQGAF
jgi:tetratricopeptide (TPR) repeat protein